MCDIAEVPEPAVPRLTLKIPSPLLRSLMTLGAIEPTSPPQRFATDAALFYMRRDSYGEWLIAAFNEEPPDWPAPG